MNSSYTGGCLAYEQVAPDSDLTGVIMYPSGENMDILGRLHYFSLIILSVKYLQISNFHVQLA